MKNKEVLRYIIKEEVTRFLKEQDEPVRITFETNPLEYILIKYPSLQKTLVNLMSEAFKDYLIGVYIMAPKPTTFKILLHNGQYFYLTYLGKAYQCEVSGRKYYLMAIGEKERAILAIANLLKLGRPASSEGPPSETTSGEETTAPDAETPPSQAEEEETES
jgi:hypothetical protein